MLAALEEPNFADLPRRDEVTRFLREKALLFYEKVIAAGDSTDPVVRRDTAHALHEAANLLIPLGRARDAEAYLARSLRLYEGLNADEPDNLNYVASRLSIFVKLGVMLAQSDGKRSLEALEAARALADRLGTGRPGSVEARVDVAWCEHNIGATLLRRTESQPRRRGVAPLDQSG